MIDGNARQLPIRARSASEQVVGAANYHGGLEAHIVRGRPSTRDVPWTSVTPSLCRPSPESSLTTTGRGYAPASMPATTECSLPRPHGAAGSCRTWSRPDLASRSVLTNKRRRLGRCHRGVPIRAFPGPNCCCASSARTSSYARAAAVASSSPSSPRRRS